VVEGGETIEIKLFYATLLALKAIIVKKVETSFGLDSRHQNTFLTVFHTQPILLFAF